MLKEVAYFENCLCDVIGFRRSMRMVFTALKIVSILIIGLKAVQWSPMKYVPPTQMGRGLGQL